jgi:hypothetical protein
VTQVSRQSAWQSQRIRTVVYLCGALLAFVRGGENVELCASSRKRTLVDIDSAQVNIDTACSPGRSETKTFVTNRLQLG